MRDPYANGSVGAAAAVRGGRGSQQRAPPGPAPAPRGQRPPSAAAEDRNSNASARSAVESRAAAAVRGGRGSQLDHQANPVRGVRVQRPPSAAAEDRNYGGLYAHRVAFQQRPPSAAAEDRNAPLMETPTLYQVAAAAVRGGRGSQHRLEPATLTEISSGRRPRRPRIATSAGPPSWPGWSRQRPPSAAAEDRNEVLDPREFLDDGQRPPSAAAEDRNQGYGRAATYLHGVQRPPSAAAEDRNPLNYDGQTTAPIGSGRRPRRPRIATRPRGQCCGTWCCSGRRPRRPRIATSMRSARNAGGMRQRPPSAAAEDRNTSRTGCYRPSHGQRPPSAAAEDRNCGKAAQRRQRARAAAAVRGGRGSQRDGWATLRKQALAAAAARGGQGSQRVGDPGSDRGADGSGRRPRRLRIAT